MSWVGCKIDEATGLLSNPLCEESDPVIFRLDILVQDERSIQPLNNVRIWFTSGFNKIYLLPQDVLEAIEREVEMLHRRMLLTHRDLVGVVEKDVGRLEGRVGE